VPEPDPFDTTRLPAEAHKPPLTPPRPRPGGKFLRGPVPWEWIEVAARLPGKALAAGLVIWKEAGCRNRRTVTVSLSVLIRLGMSRNTARRAMQSLEKAGLVTIHRAPGRGLFVTLSESSADSPNGFVWRN
jgi:hypothetical protein